MKVDAMLNSIETLPRRVRRLWLTEVLVVVAVLAFGGFAILTDSGWSPNDLANSISDFASR
jgi:hypothetical protein